MSFPEKLRKFLKIWTQIFIICFHINLYAGQSLYPSIGDWTCSAGNVLKNQTLNAGIESGQFKKVGLVGNIKDCMQHCCNEERCDVAFMARQTCYLVSCNNAFLCQPVPAKSLKFHPQIAYVSHHQKRQTVANNLQTLKMFLQHQDPQKNALQTNKLHLKSTNSIEPGHKRVVIQKNNFDTTFDEIFTSQENLNSLKPKVIKSDRCYPANVHQSVSLKYGPDSGDFYDYGKIGDMRQCVDLCCKDKLCDVAFMVGKTCYTVSCHTFEKCELIPLSIQSTLPTQLAYVIKKKDYQSEEKLRLSKQQENILQMQKDQENYLNWKFSQPLKSALSSGNKLKQHTHQKDLYNTYRKIDHRKKEIGHAVVSNVVYHTKQIDTSKDPNVPEMLTKNCHHNKIMENHALLGGQRAGIYTFRGFTPNFKACLNLCCADLFCDAAFKLGKRCYSVQCYKNGQCTSKSAKSKKLKSLLTFIERKDNLDLSEKRTSIPGLSPSDRQYTVWLNITNEDYKDEMIDNESLEFLNFAEKLRGMISGLYGNVGGFKYVEIIEFRPKVLMAILNITADKSTNPKVLLQKMVDVLRKGELLSHEDPLSGKLIIDVRGFKFLNSEGNDLVCKPEYNYDVHWPLGIYGTFVSVPCPRMASGLTTRQCTWNKNRSAKWLIPDFSDCVTYAYEALLREVQLLNSQQSHTIELTSASIIDRLLQIITSNTYGENPPKEFQSINNLKDAEPESFQKTKTANTEEQLPFNKQGLPKETLSSDQLKTLLRKLGLSALLGKTSQPDLVSLYKSISSNAKAFESARPQLMKGASSIKFPTPRTEGEKFLTLNSPNGNVATNIHISSPINPKPISFEFDKVFEPGFKSVSFTNNNKGTLIKGHTQVFWTAPKPIGDLGVESPMPGNWKGLATSFSKGKQRLADQQDAHPASVTSVSYDKDGSSVRNTVLDQNTNSTTTQSLYQKQKSWKAQSYVMSEQRKDTNNIDNQDKLEQFGLPVFESRRDSINAKQQLKSIRKKRDDRDSLEIKDLEDSRRNSRSLEDTDDFSTLFEKAAEFEVPKKHSKAKRQIYQKYPSQNDLSKYMTDYEKRDNYIGTNQKNYQINRFLSTRTKRETNTATSIINTFFNTKNHHVVRLAGQATLTEIISPRKLHLNDTVAGVSRSMTPAISDVDKVDKIDKVAFPTVKNTFSLIPLPHAGTTSAFSLPQAAKPSAQIYSYREPVYRKHIEQPLIVDIPTGRIVQKGSFSVANMSLPDGRAVDSPKETNLAAAAKDSHNININVHAEVEVNCQNKNDDSCHPKGKTEVADTNKDELHSKPSSKVIGETQVADTADDDSVTPVPTTPATVTSRHASTKPMPVEESPTVDPNYEDSDDETEPEPPHEQKTFSEKDQKPKPVIQITIINKTQDQSPGILQKPKPTRKPNQTLKPTVTEPESLPIQQKPIQSTEKMLMLKKKPTQSTQKLLETLEQEKEKPPPRGNDRIFTYEETSVNKPSPMFGGDILICADITDELLKYVSKKQSIVTIQEIEEFLQIASAILDEANEMEWKHSTRHLEQLKNENENEPQENDPADWRIIHKKKSLEKTDVLMSFVSAVEQYATTVASLFTRYNKKFQQPIITKNIIMQVRIIAVEELGYKGTATLIFPEYAKDERLSSWKCGIETISLPSEVITKKLQPSETVHLTFLRFRTVATIQKIRKDSEQGVDMDIVDASPVVVGSQILTMNVEPYMGDNMALPVSMTFSNDDLTMADFPHQCSSWNASRNSWVTDGCKMTFSNSSITTCECSHLTAFGVLVDTSGKSVIKPTTAIVQKPSKPADEKSEAESAAGVSGVVSEQKPKKTDKESDKQKIDEIKVEKVAEKQPQKSPPVNTKQQAAEKSTTTSTTTPVPTTTTTKAPTKKKTTEHGPTAGKQKEKKKGRNKWWWLWLLLLILLILLLLLCCCCIWCCCCRKKKKEETPKDQTETDAESENSQEGSDESLIDKSKIKENPRRGVVTPGSTTSAKSSSPEPGASPGWRKLLSHAHHPKQMLLREKALLFKDYVQPYHFLSSENERPDTSSESLYGGSSLTSYPNTSDHSIPRRKRSYQPRINRETRAPISNNKISELPDNVERIKTDSESSPDTLKSKRTTTRRRPQSSDEESPIIERKNVGDLMASNLTEATSMEWDPYLENKQKLNGRRGKPPSRRKRNISPISEEEEEPSKSVASLEAQNGSDALDTASSEVSSYTESAPPSARTETEDDRLTGRNSSNESDGTLTERSESDSDATMSVMSETGSTSPITRTTIGNDSGTSTTQRTHPNRKSPSHGSSTDSRYTNNR